VVATAGDDRLTAASIDLDDAARVLIARNGRWERVGIGAVTFSELTVDWAAGWSGVASDAEFRGALGERILRVAGERLAWGADGALTGAAVEVAPCDCDVPPLAVQARRVTVTPGETAAFRGGWLELFGLALVPVPAGEIPLERRSGLLPPVLGYGDDGFRAALPLYLTLGRPADLTVAPEIRTERSARGIGELRYAIPGGTGAFSGSLGDDWAVDAVRGAGEWRHQASRGASGAAVQAQLLGDPAYLQDYADAFLARATPWVESRAWAGAGPAEVWGSAFQLDPRAPDRAGAGLRLPILLPGDASLELEGAALATEDETAGAEAVRLVRETWAGPLRLRPALAGGVSSRSLAWGTAGLEVGVPAWRSTAHGRETLEPAIAARAGAGTLDPVAAVPIGGDPVDAWSIEPVLRWSHAGDGSTELQLGGAFREDGWRALATGGWSARRLHGWAQAEAGPDRPVPDLAGGGFGAGFGPVEVGGAGVYTDRLEAPLASASPTAAWTVGPVKLSVFSLFDLVAPAWQSGVGTVRWTHPQRCLAIDAAIRVDRDEPAAFRLALDVDP
jgi:hypothetical protein